MNRITLIKLCIKIKTLGLGLKEIVFRKVYLTSSRIYINYSSWFNKAKRISVSNVLEGILVYQLIKSLSLWASVLIINDSSCSSSGNVCEWALLNRVIWKSCRRFSVNYSSFIDFYLGEGWILDVDVTIIE